METETIKEYKYDAFISYRHIEPDKSIAAALQKKLETYVPPKSLREKGFKKWHLFRDETELPTSNNLGDDIRDALGQSRFLIVICSPETRKSRWCMEEIAYFKQLHGGSNQNILTLLVSGDPAEVFPEELCCEMISVTDANGNVSLEKRLTEPLAANVSAPSLKKSLSRLKTEFLRIAAPLMGCGFDDLFNREQRRRNRRIFWTAGAALAFLFCFGLYSSMMLMKISEQRNQLELVNTDLRRKNSESLTNQAKYYLEDGQQFEAIRAAIEAIPYGDDISQEINVNIEAEYVLAEAANAYVDNTQLIYNTFELASEAVDIQFSDDYERLLAYDENNYFYTIDVNRKEIVSVQSFGEKINGIYPHGQQVYVLCDFTVFAIKPEDGTVLWSFQPEESNLILEMYQNRELHTIAVLGYSGEVYFVDDSGTSIATVRMDEEEIRIASTSLAGSYSSDGNLYLVAETEYSEPGSEKKALYILDAKMKYAQVHELDELEDIQAIQVYQNELFAYSMDWTEGEILCFNLEEMQLKWKTPFMHEKIDVFGEDRPQFPMLGLFDKYEFMYTAPQYDKVVPLVVGIARNHVVGMHRETGEIVVNYALEEEIIDYGYNTEGGMVVFTETQRVYCPLNEDHFTNFYAAEYEVSPQTIVIDGEITRFGESCQKAVNGNTAAIYAIAPMDSSEIKLYDEARTCENAETIPETVSFTSCREMQLSDEGILAYLCDDYDANETRLIIYDTNEQILKTNVSVCSGDIFDIYVGGFTQESEVVLFNGEKNALCLYDLDGNVRKEFAVEKEWENSDIRHWTDIEFSGDYILLEENGHGIVIRLEGSELTQEKMLSTYHPTFFGDAFDINQKGNYVGEWYDPEKMILGIQWGTMEGDVELVYAGEEIYTHGDASHYMEISNLLISESGERIVFIENGQCIKIYNTITKEMGTIEFQVTEKKPVSVSITSDDKYILGISSDGTILKYSTKDLCLDATLKTKLLQTDDYSSGEEAEYIECGEKEYLIVFNGSALFFDYEKMQGRALLNQGTFETYNQARRQMVVLKEYDLVTRELQLQNYFTTSELIEYAESYLDRYGNH